jgi:hypothetical protein
MPSSPFRLEVVVASSPCPVPPEQRDLVVALAGLTLERAAPEELALLEEVATEYFQDPAAALSNDHDGEPLGFGLDVPLLAPYALAIAAAAVRVLLGPAVTSPPPVVPARTDAVVRGILEAGQDAPPPIDVATAHRLHQVALDRAAAGGLDPTRAALLADSLVGALTVASG